MVRGVYGKCKHCDKYASYNFPNILTAMYCLAHKNPEMINVSKKKCKIIGCRFAVSFNYENFPPIYCNMHKLDGMVNVASRKCAQSECKKQPCFSFHDSNSAFYCKSHMLPGMKNIYCKKCMFKDCLKIPSFNYVGKSPIYCSHHRLDEMINVRVQMCRINDCTKQARFNYQGINKGGVCKIHKTDSMINFIDKNKNIRKKQHKLK